MTVCMEEGDTPSDFVHRVVTLHSAFEAVIQNWLLEYGQESEALLSPHAARHSAAVGPLSASATPIPPPGENEDNGRHGRREREQVVLAGPGQARPPVRSSIDVHLSSPVGLLRACRSDKPGASRHDAATLLAEAAWGGAATVFLVLAAAGAGWYCPRPEHP